MGTRKIREGADRVYEAAQAWVDAALRSDSSLFTPGEAIWSSRWLRELREHFLDRPDVPGGKFLGKLQKQLAGRPPQVHQLMAEALYFHQLIVSARDGTPKRRSIETVLGWSPSPVVIPAELAQGLTWTFRISSGVSQGIDKSVVQSDWEFLRIGVDGRR